MPLATREGLLGSLGQVQRVNLDDERYVYVKPMSAAQIERLTAKSGGGDFDQIARMITSCVCDENGDLLFNKQDISKVKEGMSPAYMLKIAEKVSEMSGGVFSAGEDGDTAGDPVEQAEGNSGITISYDSPMS